MSGSVPIARTAPARSSPKRVGAGRQVVASALLATLLAMLPEQATAQACQGAFEAWVKLSEQHLRAQPALNASDRGACLPTEDVRVGLLNRLVRARARCESAAALAEASTEQIKTMLDINEKFVAALPICPPPLPEKPAVAAVKPGPAPAKRRAASPPCLQVSPSRPEQYALTNRRCGGETVVAVVETTDKAGKSECKVYRISRTLALRSASNAAPRINHECLSDQDRCTRDHMASMFPECDWVGP